MQIVVQDPYSKNSITLSVSPEAAENGNAWRIRFPYKFSFVLAERKGRWEVLDDINLHPAMVEEIVWALHPLVRNNADNKQFFKNLTAVTPLMQSI